MSTLLHSDGQARAIVQTNKGKLYLRASKYGEYQMINSYLLAIFLSKDSWHSNGCSKKIIAQLHKLPLKKRAFLHLWAIPQGWWWFILKSLFHAQKRGRTGHGRANLPRPVDAMSFCPNKDKAQSRWRWPQHLLESLLFLGCNVTVLRAMCRRPKRKPPSSFHTDHWKASKREIIVKKSVSLLKI